MSNKPTGREGSQYIPTLDGWRAVAILWVVVVHSPPWRLGAFTTTDLEGIGNGVTLFFVLSGFLICTRLLQEEAASGSISLRSFYIRRVFRIQPAALTYLAFLSLLGVTGIIALRWSGVAAAALMVRNFYPPLSSNFAEWCTAHFWSLAVEEHFYLLFPAFLVWVRRRRLAVLLVFVFVLKAWHGIVASHPALQGGSIGFEYRTDTAIRFILIGCVAAVAMQYPYLKALAQRSFRPWAVLLLAAIAIHHSHTNRPLFVPLYAVLLLATSLHPAALTSRFLELAPLRFLGRISFSLYLWQQFFLFAIAVPRPGSLRSHTLLCWLGAFACAIASYYWIERPFIRWGHRLAATGPQKPGQ